MLQKKVCSVSINVRKISQAINLGLYNKTKTSSLNIEQILVAEWPCVFTLCQNYCNYEFRLKKKTSYPHRTYYSWQTQSQEFWLVPHDRCSTWLLQIIWHWYWLLMLILTTTYWYCLNRNLDKQIWEECVELSFIRHGMKAAYIPLLDNN